MFSMNKDCPNVAAFEHVQIIITFVISGWVGGWGELYPSLFWIFGICLTLHSPLVSACFPGKKLLLFEARV